MIDELEFCDKWNKWTGDGDTYLDFESVQNKRASRPDLHAFLLLDELFPREGHTIISAAEHDEIWLDVHGNLLGKLTGPQIVELSQCGVRYDHNNDCLAMFV